MSEPSLPYTNLGGTKSVGHSGTDTSAERAKRETRKAGGNQAVVLRLMENSRFWGVTVGEVREVTGWHHGNASSVLSNLHAGGRIERTSVKRDGQKVYVLAEYVGGRATEVYGRRDHGEGEVTCPECHHRFTPPRKENSNG